MSSWEDANSKYGKKCDEYLKMFIDLNLKRGNIPKAILEFFENIEKVQESIDAQHIVVEIKLISNGKKVKLPEFATEIQKHKAELENLVENYPTNSEQ